jgi:hypothetical protein
MHVYAFLETVDLIESIEESIGFDLLPDEARSSVYTAMEMTYYCMLGFLLY